ncbi:MAG: acetate/propionate family kinase [Arenicella sp.]
MYLTADKPDIIMEQVSRILVINCGSSSLKFALLELPSGRQFTSGIAERLLSDRATLIYDDQFGKEQKQAFAKDYGHTHEDAFEVLLHMLEQQDFLDVPLTAVGHRVVHGGEKFSESIVIDQSVVEGIHELRFLALLHNPAHRIGIRAARQAFKNIPHVAVFDTAFHQTMPRHVYTYAIPYEFYEEQGVRRYGFHGTSHQYVTREAARLLKLDYDNSAIISAHLGNGCSTCAVLNGKSIDTSMGMTPLAGLVMGTRCGDIDPSLHSFLAGNLEYSLEKITSLLNRKSGLLGVSGVSNDMRELRAAINAGNERAKLAVDMFCYQLAKSIAGMAVALGRIDALVFTGGIGENDRDVRQQVLEQLAILGFKLDDERNAEHGRQTNGVITADGASTAVVVATNEELVIARDAERLAKGLLK